MRLPEPSSRASTARAFRMTVDGVAGVGVAITAVILGVAAAAQAGGGTPSRANSDDASYRHAAPEATPSPGRWEVYPPAGNVGTGPSTPVSLEDRQRVREYIEKANRS